MRTVYAQACIRFPLGKQGENEAVRVVWAGIVEEFRKLYGSGVFTLTAKRCGDAEAYPVAVSTEGGNVVWLVRTADVASPGSGSCELTYTVDGAVAKSQTWSTYVAASISGDAPGEPPEEPAKAWFAAIQAQIGNLDDLTTKAKASLVAAINEAAKSGGSGGGGAAPAMRVADGYIQYSADDGDTWENLIAVADLKGDPGPQGEPGTPGKDGTNGTDGHTPEITAAKSGKTTTIKADGTAIAEIQDGADGAPGQDGAPGKDGEPGKDGAPGAKGDTGATPNIQIGTVTTLDAGEDATASMGGTAENPLLNLSIPKGADGAGMDITGATVGQIAKITAVDASGKPTAWEAVDGADTWEIIADYTAAEVASWIKINKDTKGNSFLLKKADVEILLPSAVSSGSWYLYLSPSIEFFGAFSIASQGSEPCRIRCTASSDDIVTLGLKRDKDYSNDIIKLDRKDSYKAITAVRLGNWSDLTFPAGTRILVKGVRA